eukprot:scaffold1306_cov399-Prasinococcus_capsulatus_cf.AAC.2
MLRAPTSTHRPKANALYHTTRPVHQHLLPAASHHGRLPLAGRVAAVGMPVRFGAPRRSMPGGLVKRSAPTDARRGRRGSEEQLLPEAPKLPEPAAREAGAEIVAMCSGARAFGRGAGVGVPRASVRGRSLRPRGAHERRAGHRTHFFVGRRCGGRAGERRGAPALGQPSLRQRRAPIRVCEDSPHPGPRRPGPPVAGA